MESNARANHGAITGKVSWARNSPFYCVVHKRQNRGRGVRFAHTQRNSVRFRTPVVLFGMAELVEPAIGCTQEAGDLRTAHEPAEI